MPNLRVTSARLLTSLALLVGSCALLSACGWRSKELQPGVWRAVLEVPGGELPFGLDVAKEEAGFVLTLVNGEERVRVTEVKVADGRLDAVMPGYQNTLTARISGDELEGQVELVRTGGKTQVLPFKARHGQAWRFFEEPLTDNADVSGRWAVTFTDDSGKTSRAIAEFAQSFGVVTGTVLTPGGDHRFLAGEIRDDELYLSRFDGASAYLYRAHVNERGELEGEFWSGQTSHRKLLAVRDPDAVLDTSAVATELKDPAVKLEFSFPDLDGKPVSLSDPRFEGKVVIVTLAGSWCANCHDEAAFLAQLYREYHDRGLEIVALMFEHHGDFAQAAAATRRFRDKFGIEYATLIAGTSDTDDASKALPQLTGVFAYPTTIFIDRSGQVRKIHAGFAGPATGQHYEELIGDFRAMVDVLLAEGRDGSEAAADETAAATP